MQGDGVHSLGSGFQDPEKSGKKLNEFQYDIKKLYYYVPHTKINDKELLKTIKDKYKNKLPILLRSDPISRYFGFKRNDIIQIDRNENEICFRQIR